MLVCLCTIRQATFDQTCIVQAGEHPFVTSRSYVAYNWAKQQTVVEITRLVQNAGYVPSTPFAPALLARVRAGLVSSNRTPNFIKHFNAQCP